METSQHPRRVASNLPRVLQTGTEVQGSGRQVRVPIPFCALLVFAISALLRALRRRSHRTDAYRPRRSGNRTNFSNAKSEKTVGLVSRVLEWRKR